MPFQPPVSAFEKHRDALEHYEFMMGIPAGRLAVATDLLTDALVLAKQHTIYCRSLTSADGVPRDLRMIAEGIEQGKELILNVLMEIKRRKQETPSPATDPL